MSDGMRLLFGSIEVIESLPADEMRTGWNLFGELEPMCILSKPQVQCRYWPVESRGEFQSLLVSLAEESRRLGRTPILQIETHGSPDGIGFASGEFMSWVELKPLLTAINEATRLNLFVLLSACDGQYLVQVLQPVDRAAALAVIGPNRVMCPEELQTAFIAFYRAMFKLHDAAEAWRIMNNAIDPTRKTFPVFTATFSFKHVFQEFFKTMCTEEVLLEREKKIEEQAIRSGIPVDFVIRQRPVLRAYMRDFKMHFDRTRDHFFFCDQFPENAAKFPVSIEECREFPRDISNGDDNG